MVDTEAPGIPGPGRRHAAAWGGVFAYGTATLAVVRNLLLVPLYLRFIPLAEYGAWLATGATLVQIVITDYGLSGVLMQRASTLHGARRSADLGPLIGVGLVAAGALALALSLLSVAIFPFLPARSGLSPGAATQVADCFLLAVLANAIGIIGGTAQGFVRSIQLSVLAGSAALFGDIANIALTIGLLFGGFSLYALADGLVIRSVTVAAVLIGYLVARYRRDLTAGFARQWREVRGLFVDSWHSFVLSLAMKLQTQGNVFFVGALLGSESAAIYALTVRAHDTVLMLLSLMNTAFAPSMAHLLGSGNVARFRALLTRMIPVLVLCTALGMVVTVSMNRAFVHLWVGNRAFAGQGVSIVAAVALVTAIVGYSGYDALYALGQFRYIARTYVCTAIVHVLLLVGLLRFGLWTAPLVSVISSLLWGGAFLRRTIAATQMSGEEVRSVAVDLLLIVACAVGVAVGFSLLPQPRTWLALTITAAACAAAFLAGVLIIGARVRLIIQEEVSATMRSMFRRS